MGGWGPGDVFVVLEGPEEDEKALAGRRRPSRRGEGAAEGNSQGAPPAGLEDEARAPLKRGRRKGIDPMADTRGASPPPAPRSAGDAPPDTPRGPVAPNPVAQI